MQKNIIIGTIVIVILAAGGVYLMTRKTATAPIKQSQSQPQYESKEFIGQISKIEGNTLSVSGTFVIVDHPELSGPGSTKSVAVTLDANTKFQKTVLHLPNTTGFFTPDDLKKDISSVSIDMFKADLSANKVSITVLAGQNIYGSGSFTASEIDYIIPESVPLTPTNK